MKKVFRTEENSQYWDRRWTEAGSDPNRFANLSVYPIKYAEMVMQGETGRCLELGAGLGRVLKHYHYAGHDIEGLERSEVAVEKIRQDDPAIRIRAGDVLDLPYEDAAFDVILAFGLYHNLEQGFDAALAETARCLKPGGRFCISMRPNNVEMHLNEVYWRWGRRGGGEPRFHKWLVAEREFGGILARYGMRVEAIHRSRNVSILYRLPWLRGRSGSETERRGAGYRLNGVGRALDRCLLTFFPAQFCNVLVFVGRKAA